MIGVHAAPRLDRDLAAMRRAVDAGEAVRGTTSPNPWVGSVVLPPRVEDPATGVTGATAPPGGPHAEVSALRAAGALGPVSGGTLYTTLEPCSHVGRTGPCVQAVVEAGIARVVVGVEDPDPLVGGRGIEALRRAGVEVEVGVAAEEVERSLAPYLKHRRTGRPWVVLKLAATLDGRTAAPDGTSRWITGEAARADAHRLRAVSDAVLVGAGTVRADDPELTVRTEPAPERQPLRVVLGSAPADARAHPLVELSGEPGEVLDELGRRQVLQVLVEGGATVAAAFHRSGLVDRYVVYLAPALAGGDDAPGLFAGAGAPTLAEIWRGRFLRVEELGPDLKVELGPLPLDTAGSGRAA